MVLHYLVTARHGVKIPFFRPFLLHKVLWCFTCFVSPDGLMADTSSRDILARSDQGFYWRAGWFCFNHFRRDSIFEMFAIMKCNVLGKKILWWSFDCNYSLDWAGLVVVMVQWRLAGWDLRHYTGNLYLYNVSITASSTLCSVSPRHTTTQMGAENILHFSSQLWPALLLLQPNKEVKSYEVKL